jgi:hypothetical protein
MEAEIKQIARNVLGAAGLLERVRFARRNVASAAKFRETDRYLRELVAVHKNPLSRPAAALVEAWTEDQRKAQADRVAQLFADDQAAFAVDLATYLAGAADTSAHANGARGDHLAAAVASSHEGADGLRGQVLQALRCLFAADDRPDALSPAELAQRVRTALRRPVAAARLPLEVGGKGDEAARVAIVEAMLDRVCAEGLFPHALEYDFLDDIVPIIASRYVDDEGAHAGWSRAVTRALVALANVAGQDATKLGDRLHTLLGAHHRYVARKGTPNPWARQVVPELYDELLVVRGRDNPQRLLEIGKEYSARQRKEQGTWGHRLSFLVGYERDHHRMLRQLIDMTGDGRLNAADEVLVIGPRYRDEIHFFRNHLGLPKTTGLDLFDAKEDGIVAGDMHATDFASGRFRVIYTCATLTYSYDIRRCVAEMLRVLKRPGYVIISDAAGQNNGVDALGRTDWVSVDSVVGAFYEAKLSVLFRDQGRPPTRNNRTWPCVGLRID